MLLVHQKKETPGKWEVAWMWMPTFMSMDHDLVKYVDEKMTETFKGADLSDQDLPLKMHNAVIQVVSEKYKIPGLADYLSQIFKVQQGLPLSTETAA
jgi:hypothetical protein